MVYKSHCQPPRLKLKFRSEESRMDALEAGIYPMEFVQRYFASFYCVACTLMGNRQVLYLHGI